MALSDFSQALLAQPATGARPSLAMSAKFRFSIVIPTRARHSQLRNCIASIVMLQYPREQFEVVVVNDGGPALDSVVLDEFRKTLNLVYIDLPWSGPAGARNGGVAAARGEYIAFTDDDCTVLPDWLTRFDEAVKDVPDALIGGLAVNGLTDDSCATASQLLLDYLYDYFEDGQPRKGPRFFASNNLCGSTQILRRLGPFDTSFRLAAGEDRDLTDRWASSGFPLAYCANAIVQHRHAMTFKSFTRQHVNYGRGAMTFHTARARRNGARIKIEPLKFYWRLLVYPISKTGIHAPKYIALLAWSQVANAAGFFMERARTRR